MGLQDNVCLIRPRGRFCFKCDTKTTRANGFDHCKKRAQEISIEGWDSLSIAYIDCPRLDLSSNERLSTCSLVALLRNLVLFEVPELTLDAWLRL